MMIRRVPAFPIASSTSGLPASMCVTIWYLRRSDHGQPLHVDVLPVEPPRDLPVGLPELFVHRLGRRADRRKFLLLRAGGEDKAGQDDRQTREGHSLHDIAPSCISRICGEYIARVLEGTTAIRATRGWRASRGRARSRG